LELVAGATINYWVAVGVGTRTGPLELHKSSFSTF